MKVYDVFVASCVGALEHLARMESSSPAAMFIKACELQERCRGLSVRDFLLMPLEVGVVTSASNETDSDGGATETKQEGPVPR